MWNSNIPLGLLSQKPDSEAVIQENFIAGSQLYAPSLLFPAFVWEKIILPVVMQLSGPKSLALTSPGSSLHIKIPTEPLCVYYDTWPDLSLLYITWGLELSVHVFITWSFLPNKLKIILKLCFGGNSTFHQGSRHCMPSEYITSTMVVKEKFQMEYWVLNVYCIYHGVFASF